MRLKVRHETVYTYEEPTVAVTQILRLTPRNHRTQFVNRWRVEIDAECRLDRREDPFGNITHTFSLETATDALRMMVEGEVEVEDTSGVVQGTAERFPPQFWLRESQLTQPDAAIVALAKETVASEKGQTLPILHGLMERISDLIAMSDEPRGQAVPAATAFAAGTGSDRDFAQVFVAASRAAGIPSRYVSGYLLLLPGIEQKSGHGWAESYVEGLGWIGFDPSQALCVTDRYVRVAVGADYLDAAPVRGFRAGGGDEKMEVSVSVTQARMVVEG